MYDSLILRAVAHVMLPFLLVLGLVLFVRGTSAPGGGIIGGLLAAMGIIVLILACGPAYVRRVIRVDLLSLAALGVFLTVTWGALPLASGRAFMTSLWVAQDIPLIGRLGTPMLIDSGVFLAVAGAISEVALLLAEEQASKT